MELEESKTVIIGLCVSKNKQTCQCLLSPGSYSPDSNPPLLSLKTMRKDSIQEVQGESGRSCPPLSSPFRDSPSLQPLYPFWHHCCLSHYLCQQSCRQQRCHGSSPYRVMLRGPQRIWMQCILGTGVLFFPKGCSHTSAWRGESLCLHCW